MDELFLVMVNDSWYCMFLCSLSTKYNIFFFCGNVTKVLWVGILAYFCAQLTVKSWWITFSPALYYYTLNILFHVTLWSMKPFWIQFSVFTFTDCEYQHRDLLWLCVVCNRWSPNWKSRITCWRTRKTTWTDLSKSRASSSQVQ